MNPTENSARRPPLLVHLVFHPESDESRRLARRLHAALNEDPAVPGLRIPTTFCAEEGGRPPADHDLDTAERSFVVALADIDINADDRWCAFVADLWEGCQSSPHRCLPMQLHEDSWPLDPRLEGASFSRAFAEPEAGRFDFVLRRLVVELCRYLHGDAPGGAGEGAPTKLFLSHTKHDLKREPRVVEALKRSLDAGQPIDTWFDTGDIPGGSRFAVAIESGILDASLLCVLTDSYASREWCRREILLAKGEQRPIVVLDALSSHEVRSFPYLGNLPVVRWDGDPQRAIDLVLKETLRHLHCEKLLAGQGEADIVFTRPPELATVAPLAAGTTVLYPDPPLGAEESALLETTGVSCSTPLGRLSAAKSLAGRRLALSVSESTDIARFGFDSIHLEAASLELSRHLLVEGATLVYGGHLGDAGYTVQLVELVRAHNRLAGAEPVDRLENYVGWPLPHGKELISKFKEVAKLRRVERPDGIDEELHPDLEADPKYFPGDRSPVHRYAWARGMTHMREVETDETSARIVLGGTFGPTEKRTADGKTTQWYFGRIPGLLEEIVASVEARQPLFLVGAFGGVPALVMDLLDGRERQEMSWDYQQQAPHAPEMRALYGERGDRWQSYREMTELLRDRGLGGLNPWLSESEHRELFGARDVAQIVELVLRGLSRAG